jgi:hypothetical protein
MPTISTLPNMASVFTLPRRVVGGVFRIGSFMGFSWEQGSEYPRGWLLAVFLFTVPGPPVKREPLANPSKNAGEIIGPGPAR